MKHEIAASAWQPAHDGVRRRVLVVSRGIGDVSQIPLVKPGEPFFGRDGVHTLERGACLRKPTALRVRLSQNVPSLDVGGVSLEHTFEPGYRTVVHGRKSLRRANHLVGAVDDRRVASPTEDRVPQGVFRGSRDRALEVIERSADRLDRNLPALKVAPSELAMLPNTHRIRRQPLCTFAFRGEQLRKDIAGYLRHELVRIVVELLQNEVELVRPNLSAAVRAATETCWLVESAVMTSSVIPSARNSISLSVERLVNGSTTIPGFAQVDVLCPVLGAVDDLSCPNDLNKAANAGWSAFRSQSLNSNA